jgi:hypothetical protein
MKALWSLLLICALVLSVHDGAAGAPSGQPAAAAPSAPSAPSAPAAPAGASADANETLRQLRKLSIDVRGAPLSKDESATIKKRLERESTDAIYASFVDGWLKDLERNQDFVEKVLSPFEPKGMPLLFLNPSQFRAADGREVLYLPARQPKTGTPCAGQDIVSVRPWWSKQPVAICSASYVPEVVFANDRFCAQSHLAAAGYTTPDACGCGPRLMHCAPPEKLDPGIVVAIKTGPKAEIRETMIDLLIKKRRPLSDVYTATTTWQNGLVQFIYKRREVASIASRTPITKPVLAKLEKMIDSVNVRAKPKWVERKGAYKGTGLWWTTALPVQSTYRNSTRGGFNFFFCIDYSSINVDRDALLATAGDEIQNLRALDAISNSPMRKQDGCKGCHMPMDTTAGFLFEFELSWRGGFPRHEPAQPTDFYLQGAEDRRGNGKGLAGLMALFMKQPEFDACAVQKTLVNFVARGPMHSERATSDALVEGLRKHNRDLVWLVREVLMSPIYRRGS